MLTTDCRFRWRWWFTVHGSKRSKFDLHNAHIDRAAWKEPPLRKRLIRGSASNVLLSGDLMFRRVKKFEDMLIKSGEEMRAWQQAMMREVNFPAEAKGPIEANGGTCVAAYAMSYGDHFVGVLVSDDPSGRDGAAERHLSVSASTRGVRRMPANAEVAKAMEAAKVASDACRIVRGKDVIHSPRDQDKIEFDKGYADCIAQQTAVNRMLVVLCVLTVVACAVFWWFQK